MQTKTLSNPRTNDEVGDELKKFSQAIKHVEPSIPKFAMFMFGLGILGWVTGESDVTPTDLLFKK